MQSVQASPQVWEITFYYVNGEKESFNLYNSVGSTGTVQDVPQELRRLMREDWLMLKTPEQSICVKAENLLKIEVKPPLDAIEGEKVLANAERVTALKRGARL